MREDGDVFELHILLLLHVVEDRQEHRDDRELVRLLVALQQNQRQAPLLALLLLQQVAQVAPEVLAVGLLVEVVYEVLLLGHVHHELRRDELYVGLQHARAHLEALAQTLGRDVVRPRDAQTLAVQEVHVHVAVQQDHAVPLVGQLCGRAPVHVQLAVAQHLEPQEPVESELPISQLGGPEVDV